MKSISLLDLMLFVGLPLGAFATETYKLAPISALQLNSSAAPIPNVMWVSQDNASWAVSSNCPQDYAWFNSKDNPHFTADVLAAKYSGTSARIYIDDSLPMPNDKCQVVYIVIP